MGSSPLARGLRHDTAHPVGAVRIIPARAGFTSPRSLLSRRRRDHPRSRGVYASQFHTVNRQEGSSPLARGLPPVRPPCRMSDGIIPARAGFTLGSTPSTPLAGDHPRSRGVYLRGAGMGRAAAGSSPLARGLRVRQIMDATLRRIIPARAGFTGPAGPCYPRTGDHPRSRGVYALIRRDDPDYEGSSPLARGLRLRVRRHLRGDRIIPARAGFTPGREPASSSPSDHPRSRGVYEYEGQVSVYWFGSSPLARGLQGRWGHAASCRGIIPARAGFTKIGASSEGPLRDHPRSRGVYGLPDPLGAPNAGSSPLARGLRQRASPRTRPPTDHPRSRGVYLLEGGGAAEGAGSSPLARGLPDGGGGQVRHRRIIPARAGFTRTALSWTLTSADHPRSRGVYCACCGAVVLELGSSPLARGLRPASAGVSLARGIIPARAGFTGRWRR